MRPADAQGVARAPRDFLDERSPSVAHGSACEILLDLLRQIIDDHHQPFDGRKCDDPVEDRTALNEQQGFRHGQRVRPQRVPRPAAKMTASIDRGPLSTIGFILHHGRRGGWFVVARSPPQVQAHRAGNQQDGRQQVRPSVAARRQFRGKWDFRLRPGLASSPPATANMPLRGRVNDRLVRFGSADGIEPLGQAIADFAGRRRAVSGQLGQQPRNRPRRRCRALQG